MFKSFKSFFFSIVLSIIILGIIRILLVSVNSEKNPFPLIKMVVDILSVVIFLLCIFGIVCLDWFYKKQKKMYIIGKKKSPKR
jgi:uncharacterized membrane protein YdjX (TVP38/TMEM64 family)